MPFKLNLDFPENFFTKTAHKADRASAAHIVRMIVKQKDSNWQDTVLLCEGGLPQGTEIVLNCYPGKDIPHQLVRALSSGIELRELESNSLNAESELVEASRQLEENRNTSPVTLPEHRFSEFYRFVNEKIWYKCHLPKNGLTKDGHALLEITPDEWYRFQMVNKKYAKALARDILKDVLEGRQIDSDLNWSHDYQLMLVFRYLEYYLYAGVDELALSGATGQAIGEQQAWLRASLPQIIETLKTSYFHHIPWPDRETFVAEFPSIAYTEPSGYESDDSDGAPPLEHHGLSGEPFNTGKAIVDGLLFAKHVAFQTEKDANHFLDCVAHYYPKAAIHQMNAKYNTVTLVSGQLIKVCVNPIGTDYDRFAEMDFSDASLAALIGKQLGVTIAYEGVSDEEAFEPRLKALLETIQAVYFEKLTKAFEAHFGLSFEKWPSLDKMCEMEGVQADRAEANKAVFLEEVRAAVSGYSENELAQGCEKFLKAAQGSVIQLDKIYVDLCHDYWTIESLKAFKARNPNPKVQYLTSIGRLDPAKNVPAVLDAYQGYLQDCFKSNKPIQNALLLFTVPSRLEVRAYRKELKSILYKYDEVCTLLREHDHAPEEWIHLAGEEDLRAYREVSPVYPKLISPNGMAEFYRHWNVCVSSLADGMNLVIKEWVAAQDRILKSCLHAISEFIKAYSPCLDVEQMSSEDEADFLIYASALNPLFDVQHSEQLISKLKNNFMRLMRDFFASYEGRVPELPLLSKYAGAAYQLEEAFLIDPLDIHSMVRSLHEMAELDPVKRVARAWLLKETVSKENGRHWRRSIFDEALGNVGLLKSQEALVGSKLSLWASRDEAHWQVFHNPMCATQSPEL